MDESPIRIPIEAELDLHAFAPADIVSVVDEYVNAAAALGLREVRLVHGRGRGVLEFWDDPAAHLGATIARLSCA